MKKFESFLSEVFSPSEIESVHKHVLEVFKQMYYQVENKQNDLIEEREKYDRTMSWWKSREAWWLSSNDERLDEIEYLKNQITDNSKVISDLGYIVNKLQKALKEIAEDDSYKDHMVCAHYTDLKIYAKQALRDLADE